MVLQIRLVISLVVCKKLFLTSKFAALSTLKLMLEFVPKKSGYEVKQSQHIN